MHPAVHSLREGEIVNTGIRGKSVAVWSKLDGPRRSSWGAYEFLLGKLYSLFVVPVSEASSIDFGFCVGRFKGQIVGEAACGL